MLLVESDCSSDDVRTNDGDSGHASSSASMSIFPYELDDVVVIFGVARRDTDRNKRVISERYMSCIMIDAAFTHMQPSHPTARVTVLQLCHAWLGPWAQLTSLVCVQQESLGRRLDRPNAPVFAESMNYPFPYMSFMLILSLPARATDVVHGEDIRYESQ